MFLNNKVFYIIYKNATGSVNSFSYLLARPSTSVFTEEYAQEARRSMQSQLRGLTAYDRHKMLINQYYLAFPGANLGMLKRDQYVVFFKVMVKKHPHKYSLTMMSV